MTKIELALLASILGGCGNVYVVPPGGSSGSGGASSSSTSSSASSGSGSASSASGGSGGASTSASSSGRSGGAVTCDGGTTLGTTSSCGACGEECSSNNASASCTLGACMFVCDPGYADCNGTAGASNPQTLGAPGIGALLRVPLQGGPTEVVMATIDARNLALSTESVFFSSWSYGLVLEIAKPAM